MIHVLSNTINYYQQVSKEIKRNPKEHKTQRKMGQIATTAQVQVPEGGKIARSKAISPVYFTRVRTVGIDMQTVELQLEQMFEAPLNGQGGVLAFTMSGHSAFNSGPRKRVSWQNFSVVTAVAQGLIRSWDEVSKSKIELPDGTVMEGAMKVERELILKDGNGKVIPVKLVEVDTFTPRTWKDRNTGKEMTQRPKTAGLDGDLLTFNGKPIYRNTGLSMPGAGDALTGREWDEDLVILHNNTVVGSSVRGAMAKAGIVIPKVPGSPEGAGALDKDGNPSRPAADPALQNKGIGQTPNLLRGTGEPSRHTPNEQTQPVAEKTAAQEARERGERPVVQNP